MDFAYPDCFIVFSHKVHMTCADRELVTYSKRIGDSNNSILLTIEYRDDVCRVVVGDGETDIFACQEEVGVRDVGTISNVCEKMIINYINDISDYAILLKNAILK